MKRRRRGAAARRRRRLAFWLLAGALLAVAMEWLACAGGPPRNPDDLCAIFEQKRAWYRGARQAAERWGVPEAVQLAIIYQESSFRGAARPPRRRILWVLPGPRPSSAYGYGQVVDSTWDRYRRSSGRRGASRRDFGDVADFIGWYARRIHERTGIAPNDARSLYLAYHEGPGGYSRGTHLSKSALLLTAKRVGLRAGRYQRQYGRCREALARYRWWWPF